MYDGFNMTDILEKKFNNSPEESYHKKLEKMIKKVKTETKWRNIFKIVGEAQRRLNGKSS